MILYDAETVLRKLLEDYPQLKEKQVVLVSRALNTKEAIGKPTRRDFPLLQGKEVLVQAEIDACPGQAFTSDPLEYEGTIESLLATPQNRLGYHALVLAALNAAARSVGLVDHTVHCYNDEPEECGVWISNYLKEQHGEKCCVGIIGYQPALLENCVQAFGADQVHITDLNPANIGQMRFGVEVWDGMTRTEELVHESDVLMITGTVLGNETSEEIVKLIGNKTVYFFGTTAAAMAKVHGWKRLCPMSH